MDIQETTRGGLGGQDHIVQVVYLCEQPGSVQHGLPLLLCRLRLRGSLEECAAVAKVLPAASLASLTCVWRLREI
nr:hypothetical protein [uncultured Oscillibacter sp.]